VVHIGGVNGWNYVAIVLEFVKVVFCRGQSTVERVY
jgi:hypothetical protein